MFHPYKRHHTPENKRSPSPNLNPSSISRSPVTTPGGNDLLLKMKSIARAGVSGGLATNRSSAVSSPKPDLSWTIPITSSPRGSSDSEHLESLLKARSEIATLKHDLSQAKLELGQTAIQLEKRNQELEMEVSNAYQKVEKLEADRKFLMDLEKQLQEKLEASSKERSQQETLLKEQIAKLQETNHQLQTRIISIESQKDSFVQEARLQNTFLSQENSVLNEKIQELGEQIALQSRLNHAKEETLRSLENRLNESEKNRNQSGSADTDESVSYLRKNAAEQATYISNLEKQLATLKDDISFYKATHENASRLREEKTSLEKKLELFKTISKELSESRVKVATLEAEKQRWLSFFSSLPEGDRFSRDPYEFGRVFVQSQATIELLNQKVQRLQERNQARDSFISELENKVHSAEQKEHESTSRLRFMELQMKRIEQSKQLLQRETDLLRGQLESYTVEEKLLMSTSYDSRKDDRIQELESLVQQQKQQIEKISNELSTRSSQNLLAPINAKEASSVFSPEVARVIRELEQKLDTTKSENVVLQKEIESLQKQISVLSNSLPKQDFDPSTTRVLMLADNPESQFLLKRKERMDTLIAENQRLRKELEQVNGQLLQSHKNGHNNEPSTSSMSSSYVPKESLKAKEVECNQLKSELETAEKRLLRLKEVFTTKAQEFRALVVSLFGYQMDVGMDGTCKLSSLLVPPDQGPVSFLVKMDRSAIVSFQIVGGSPEFRDTVGRWVKQYLQEQENVPLFFSRFTLEMSS